MKRILFMFTLIGLVGCVSSYTNQYASTGDWSGLAYYDVEHGIKSRSVNDLDELGATTEQAQAAYRNAYKEHVSVYCQPENAYRAGILQKPRNAVCIDDTPTGWEYEQNWRQAYDQQRF